MRRRDSAPNLAAILVALGALATASAVAVGDYPPRYVVTELDALDGGNTRAEDLNDLGQTTGDSGQSLGNGYRAFLGQPDGSVEDIEAFECYRSIGLAMNESGQVAGRFVDYPNGSEAVYSFFRYEPDLGMVDLDWPDDAYCTIVDMNESGHFVGRYSTIDGNRAYIYTDENGFEDLGTLGGTYTTEPLDMNDQGQVVGYSWVTGPHAFLWEDGVMHDLGTFGGTWSKSYYVNRHGVVVGESEDADGVMHAFRYTKGRGMEMLPAPPEATSCKAVWVTDAGMITGWWTDQDFRQRAFYYTDDAGMIDLGLDLGATSWTGPVAANDDGQILLWLMDDQSYEVFAYIFAPEFGAHDLNDLTTIELDWQISDPIDINASGQILVQGFRINRYKSAVLTPVQSGDLNCDGAVNGFDIDPFVLALGNEAAYAEAYPRCAAYLADVNDDGEVNGFDIDPFVALLGGE